MTFETEQTEKPQSSQYKPDISYTNMRNVFLRSHVRRKLTSRDKARFSVCWTSFGWLGNEMKEGSLQQDLAGQIGIAIMIYFKQLKCILIMLAVLTFLSIPQIVILSIQMSHRKLYDITKLNIGVVSQSTIQCQQKDYDQNYNRLNFYCPSGSLLSQLEKFEIGEA